MRNEKSAPFGLAGLGGAERNEAEKNNILPHVIAQGAAAVYRGSCIQCRCFIEQVTSAGVCLYMLKRRSFLMAQSVCTCGGFEARQVEEVLA